MEKNRNPNSHECLLRQDQSSSWSELPLDLLSSVFERLDFADFTRGKSVCSSWYYASRQSVPKNQTPWLILFPKKRRKNRCTLFNPKEKDKSYKTQDLGLEFGKNVCVATYGNWLLMRDPRYNLYIVNLFTQERINIDCESRVVDDIQSLFWVDEKTKDYVVIWQLKTLCVVYCKKGDKSWRKIPETSDCRDLVYKDHKLYFLSRFGNFKIFDFSGEIPQETFQSGVVVNEPSLGWNVAMTKLVVTVTGDVLKVEEMFRFSSAKLSFRIYKVFSSASGFLNKPEQADSLGDEAMLFDLGVTVLANDVEGFHRNSICFISRCPNKAISLFNLKTHKSKQLKNFCCPSSPQFSRARWFLPSFMRT